jgi:hypothetical protein
MSEVGSYGADSHEYNGEHGEHIQSPNPDPIASLEREVKKKPGIRSSHRENRDAHVID